MSANIEQDHRFIKKIRITPNWTGGGAWRTIEGYEAMHAIRKGQVRWARKAMPSRNTIFGVAAYLPRSSKPSHLPSSPFATEPTRCLQLGRRVST
jgi:hypothetical protein